MIGPQKIKGRPHAKLENYYGEGNKLTAWCQSLQSLAKHNMDAFLMYLFPVKQLDHMCYSENNNSCSPLLSLECSKHQIMSYKQLFHLLNWLFPHLHLMHYNLSLHIAPHSCSHCYRTEVDSNSMFLLFLHNRNLQQLVYQNNKHSLHVWMFIIWYVSDNAHTQTLFLTPKC